MSDPHFKSAFVSTERGPFDFLQFVYVRFLLFHLCFGYFCVMTVSCMMVVTVIANALGGIATK